MDNYINPMECVVRLAQFHGVYSERRFLPSRYMVSADVLADKIAEIVSECRKGNKINAIKVMCEITGLPLMESKNAIEKVCSPYPASSAFPPPFLSKQELHDAAFYIRKAADILEGKG